MCGVSLPFRMSTRETQTLFHLVPFYITCICNTGGRNTYWMYIFSKNRNSITKPRRMYSITFLLCQKLLSAGILHPQMWPYFSTKIHDTFPPFSSRSHTESQLPGTTRYRSLSSKTSSQIQISSPPRKLFPLSQPSTYLAASRYPQQTPLAGAPPPLPPRMRLFLPYRSQGAGTDPSPRSWAPVSGLEFHIKTAARCWCTSGSLLLRSAGNCVSSVGFPQLF